ncbi:MAG: hypothetical protein RLZZ351_991, partial [Pseudomonadota bacterium]
MFWHQGPITSNMFYAIIDKDQQNSLDQRLVQRPAHLARIK